MNWNTDITVEKLRQLADDVERGEVRVQRVEYKASDYGSGVTAELSVHFHRPLEPKP